VALSINDVKAGLTILVDDGPFLVVETQHVKPGKGAAFVRAKIRNLKNGNIQERTFRGDEKIDPAFIDERKLQYSYCSGDMYHFMDRDNYEEVAIAKEHIETQVKFLKDNLEVSAYFYNNEVLNITLPNFIEVEIKNSEPGIKGDTAKSGTKPAEIETGAIIQVPLFINAGDRIKVDTRTGSYVERVY
jgi:elongation factor P